MDETRDEMPAQEEVVAQVHQLTLMTDHGALSLTNGTTDLRNTVAHGTIQLQIARGLPMVEVEVAAGVTALRAQLLP